MKELADAKAENDALRDDVAAGRRRLYQSSLSVSAWSYPLPPVDNAASWTGITPNGIISPSERGWSLCKNNWKEPRSILMSSADRVAHIDGQLMQLLWAHTRFQRRAMPKVIKPSNPFTNVCWVSVLTTFSAPPQILAASTVFFCPIPETKKWWVMVSFGATAAGLFWTVNVCWAHPVISRASSSEQHFFICGSMLFEACTSVEN